MAEIKSHNTSSKDAIKSLLIPTLVEAFFYLFVSVLLLALLKVETIWKSVKDSLSSTTMSREVVTNNIPAHSFWQSVSDSRLPQILFWVAVGLLMYGLVWFVWNLSNNVRNDIVADDYVHPRTYNRRRYWQSLIVRKAFFAVSIIVLIIYVIVFFNMFSVMADLCHTAIKEFEPKSSLGVLISSPLVGGLLIHFLVVLGRITLNAWRTIYIDL